MGRRTGSAPYAAGSDLVACAHEIRKQTEVGTAPPRLRCLATLSTVRLPPSSALALLLPPSSPEPRRVCSPSRGHSKFAGRASPAARPPPPRSVLVKHGHGPRPSSSAPPLPRPRTGRKISIQHAAVVSGTSPKAKGAGETGPRSRKALPQHDPLAALLPLRARYPHVGAAARRRKHAAAHPRRQVPVPRRDDVQRRHAPVRRPPTVAHDRPVPVHADGSLAKFLTVRLIAGLGIV